MRASAEYGKLFPGYISANIALSCGVPIALRMQSTLSSVPIVLRICLPPKQSWKRTGVQTVLTVQVVDTRCRFVQLHYTPLFQTHFQHLSNLAPKTFLRRSLRRCITSFVAFAGGHLEMWDCPIKQHQVEAGVNKKYPTEKWCWVY